MDNKKSTAFVIGMLVIGTLTGAGGFYAWQQRDLAMPPKVSVETANRHYAPERNDIAWSVPQKTSETEKTQ